MSPRMHALVSPTSSGGIWSIERVVALFTPAFAAGAGWVTSIVAKAIPGVNLPSGWVAALFGIGATAGLSAALKWLHGRQKFVNFTTDSEHIIQEVTSRLQAVGGLPLQEIEHMLESHASSIVQQLGDKIGAPNLAETIAQEIVKQLWPQQAAQASAAGTGAARAS